MKIKGFKFSGKACGLKKTKDPDVGLMVSAIPLRVSAVFTKNKIKAAPVLLSRANKNNIIRALIVNSGNANACTGKEGMKDAKSIMRAVAGTLGVSTDNVLICSTGVIGERLNAPLIEGAIPGMAKIAREDRIPDFARSIMTTDTFPKVVKKEINISGGVKKYTIIGVAKGSGMIMPDMATMLSFIFTDIPINAVLGDKMFRECVNSTFNSITVDGDTSTNDTAIFFHPDENAEDKSAYTLKNKKDKNYSIVSSALFDICSGLAAMIVKDGEGASKVVKIEVKGAYSVQGAKKVAFTVANSPLFKTMIAGEDLNWGRVMGAVGRAGARIKPEFIDIYIQGKKVVENSVSSGKISKKTENTLLSPENIRIEIDLKCGKGNYTVLTCDLTEKYIEINGSYRS